jgi:RNA-directed DNA polymerase
MMHGLEKSDLAIVATKPANKVGRPAAEWGGAKGGGRGEHGTTTHATDSEPR